MTRRESGSVLELHAVPAGVIGCFGRRAALDRIAASSVSAGPLASLDPQSAAFMRPAVRVAPDELLLLNGLTNALPTDGGIAALEAELRALDENGLVVDLSSGYTTWALSGDDRFEAFRRLSVLELPDPPPSGSPRSARPAVAIQGLVAHVPAKVIVLPDALLLIVSSVLAHHIRERVLTACADLSPTEGSSFRLDTVLMEEGGVA